MRVQRPVAIAFAGMVLVSSVASAHHGRAGYDMRAASQVTLTGVVSEVAWRNPHVYLAWDVKDSTGKTVTWYGELSSPGVMMADGVHRLTFKNGDTVSVTLMPAKGGTPQGLILKVVQSDGTVIIDLFTRLERYIEK